MKRVGILGGGQLARMLGMAALRLGLRLRVFDPAPNAPAAAVAEHIRGDWLDFDAIDRFCAGLDLATVELEEVPVRTAERIASRVPLRPSPSVLRATQDRLAEKELGRTLGIEVPAFARVDGAARLEAAAARTGLPAVLKRRRGGYDGRGQVVVRTPDDLQRAFADLGGTPCTLEALVPFDRELSQLVVRGLDGSLAFYPLVENLHCDGVLRRSIAPAPAVDPSTARRAREIAVTIAEVLGHVGVLTVELFACGDRLLMNEVAPRVHNSGHWTIEGAVTSQFENHLRAITGLPLGSTEAVGCSLLRNILGVAPDPARVLGVRGAALHLYGKATAPRRKLGHVTVRAASAEELVHLDSALLEALGVAGGAVEKAS